MESQKTNQTDRIDGKKMENSVIVVEDLSILLLIMNRTKQKVNKKSKDFNNNMYQLTLTSIYQTLHPTAAEKILLKHG